MTSLQALALVWALGTAVYALLAWVRIRKRVTAGCCPMPIPATVPPAVVMRAFPVIIVVSCGVWPVAAPWFWWRLRGVPRCPTCKGAILGDGGG